MILTTRWVVEVAELIAPFVREHGGDEAEGIHMLGTSGTVTTIAACIST